MKTVLWKIKFYNKKFSYEDITCTFEFRASHLCKYINRLQIFVNVLNDPMSTLHKLNFIQILKFKQGTYYLDQPTFLQKVQMNSLGNLLKW